MGRKSLLELELRKRHRLNVVAIVQNGKTRTDIDPEEPLTAGELGRALSRASGEEIVLAEEEDEIVTEERLLSVLREQFPDLDARTAVRRIAGRGGETVTRAEAAAALDLLFDIAPGIAPGDGRPGKGYILLEE